MTGPHAEGFIQNARIVRKPLVVWYGPPMLFRHEKTGRPVHIGHLTRTGDRHHA